MSCKDSVQTTAEPASELCSDGTDRSVEHDTAERCARAPPELLESSDWDPFSGVKGSSLQPSRKQRLVEQQQLKMQQRELEQQPEGDSSDDDVSSSNERLERRYRTRGRRGGRRRRKNREADWPDARTAEGGAPLLYEGYEPVGYPGSVGSYFPPELEEMTKTILASAPPLPAYWNPRPMMPQDIPGANLPPPMPVPVPRPAAPVPPPPKVHQAPVATAPAAPAVRPAPRPELPAEPPDAGGSTDTPLHALLLQLLDSQLTQLLPDGAPEVDRGRLTRTLLSVYEQLQTLKGALGEKTTLSLLSLMMQQTPTMSRVNGAAGGRSRGASEDQLSPSSGPAPQSPSTGPPGEQPELLQPTPTGRPVPQPFHMQGGAPRNPPMFRAEPEDGSSESPMSRPPTESPGPNQMGLLPSDLFKDVEE